MVATSDKSARCGGLGRGVCLPELQLDLFDANRGVARNQPGACNSHNDMVKQLVPNRPLFTPG